jgi:hypothetical protein
MEEQSNTIKFIIKLFKDAGTDCIELIGSCQSCKREVSLVIFRKGMEVEGNGGMIVSADHDAIPEFKCYECLERDGGKISPTRCEVFSRVCGYLRPVKGFNPGKKAEFDMRKNYLTGEK